MSHRRPMIYLLVSFPLLSVLLLNVSVIRGVPVDDPALPSAFDSFDPGQQIPSFVTGAPVFAEWIRTAGRGDTVAATGESFSNFVGSDAGKDARVIVFGQSGSNPGVFQDALIQRLDDQKIAFTIGDGLPNESMYLVWAQNSTGYSSPIKINHTEAWWLGPERVTRGDTVCVYGRNLSHDQGTESSWVYIQPETGQGQWATVTGVNPYKVDFVVPSGLTNGNYEIWVHNGHGGSYGWSSPVTMVVDDGLSWTGGTYDVTSYGAVGDGVADDAAAIEAAKNAAASDPYSTIYFPAGTYSIGFGFLPPANVRWQGAGIDQTFIQLNNKFVKPSFFFNGLIDDARVYNSVLSSSQITTLGTQAGQNVPGATPASHWNWEGDANDSAGINNGTISEGAGATSPATFTSGTDGQAISLDGFNDYVDFGDVLDPAGAGQTIGVWFQRSNDYNPKNQWIVSKGNYAATDVGWSVFISPEGELVVRCSDGTNVAAQTGPTITDHNWHHVTLVLDLSGNQIRGYFDGSSSGWSNGGGGASSDSLSGFGSLANSDELVIGIVRDAAAIPSSYDNRYLSILFAGGDNIAVEDLTLDTNNNLNGYLGLLMQRRNLTDTRFTRVRFDARNYRYFDLHGSDRVFFKDSIVIGGGCFLGTCDQVFVKGTDFYGTNDANVLFEFWGATRVSMTYCTAQDLDNSDVNSGAGWAQGRFFYGNNIWASNRNIYVGHSTTTDLSVRPGFWNQNSGEQILFEGGDGRLGATVSSGAADTITLNGVTNPVYGDGRYMLSVTSGKGLGQTRRLVAYDEISGAYSVEPDWNVVPASTSTVALGLYTARFVAYDNDLDGKAYVVTNPTHIAAAGVSIYGAAADVVVAQNRITQLRQGLASWGLGDKASVSEPLRIGPNYFTLFVDNDFADVHTGIVTIPAFYNAPGESSGAALLGNVFRGNAFDDVSVLGVKHYVSWNGDDTPLDLTVYEQNVFVNLPFGFETTALNTGDKSHNAILLNNLFDLGTATYSGSVGLETEADQKLALGSNEWIGFQTTYDSTLGEVLEVPRRVFDTTLATGQLGIDTLLVWNAGTSSLSWQLSDDASWLSLSSTSGSVVDEADQAPVFLSIDPYALSPGAHTATLTATAGSQVQKGTVTLNLVSPAGYLDNFVRAFPNPGFETQGMGVTDADVWLEYNGAVRDTINPDVGSAAMFLDGTSSSIAEARYSPGWGTWAHGWTADTTNADVNARPGTVYAFYFRAANDSSGTSKITLLPTTTGLGGQLYGINNETVTSLAYETIEVAGRRTTSMVGAWNTTLAFRMYSASKVYVDELSDIRWIRPELQVSDISHFNLGVVAPSTVVDSEARDITNAQMLTGSDTGSGSVATVLYGTANVSSDTGSTDHVGATIIGAQAFMFEFVTTHAGANARELKLVGADGVDGLTGGLSPEVEPLQVRFLGTATAGTYEATVRVVTSADNQGTVSTGAGGDPLVGLRYLDLPIRVIVE